MNNQHLSGTEMALAAVSAMANNAARIRNLESDLKSETAWARHYHDCCIAIREAAEPLMVPLEWLARTDGEVACDLERFRLALARIDTPDERENA
jgi:hypothetical protein